MREKEREYMHARMRIFVCACKHYYVCGSKDCCFPLYMLLTSAGDV